MSRRWQFTSFLLRHAVTSSHGIVLPMTLSITHSNNLRISITRLHASKAFQPIKHSVKMRRNDSRYRTSRAAQPGIAADRFAREIVRFLTVIVARSRRLIGIPLDHSQTPLVGQLSLYTLSATCFVLTTCGILLFVTWKRGSDENDGSVCQERSASLLKTYSRRGFIRFLVGKARIVNLRTTTMRVPSR